MGWSLAAFVTYGVCHRYLVIPSSLLTSGWRLGIKQAFVVDGNHLTNLMSIGANTTADDELTPGLDIHGNFEGQSISLYSFGNHALIAVVRRRC